MEFQAIILAGGKGNRLHELTKKVPKCLLPIGNKPMVWYPARFLEKAGFNGKWLQIARIRARVLSI
jgi:translation initiation factor eIF-2B subunit gamma